jgi:hypothetical protein
MRWQRSPRNSASPIVLVHAFDWTMSEVADLLGVATPYRCAKAGRTA